MEATIPSPIAVLTYYYGDECVPRGNWYTCTHPPAMFFIRNSTFLKSTNASMKWNTSANTADRDANTYANGSTVPAAKLTSCTSNATLFYGAQFGSPIWDLSQVSPTCTADTSLANTAVKHSPNVSDPSKIVIYSDRAAKQAVAGHPRLDQTVDLSGDPANGSFIMASVPEGQTFLLGTAAGDGWWCYVIGPGTFNIGDFGDRVTSYFAMQTLVSFHQNLWTNGSPLPPFKFDAASAASETKLADGTRRCLCVADFVHVSVVTGPREGFAGYQVGVTNANDMPNAGTQYTNPASGLQPPVRFTLSAPGFYNAGSQNWAISGDNNWGKFSQDWIFYSVMISKMTDKPNAAGTGNLIT